MDRVKIYIESDLIDLTEVRPILSGDFEIGRESGKVFYRHKLKDALRFHVKEEFDLLLQHRESECSKVTVYIDTLCAGEYSRYWAGQFKVFGATIDYDACYIEAKPEPLDGYQCFEQAAKQDVNTYVGTAVEVKAIAGTYEEQICVSDPILDADCDDYENYYLNPNDSCIVPSEWCLKDNIVTVDGQVNDGTFPDCESLFSLEQQTVWHRETALGTCDNGTPVPPDFGIGWSLLTQDCGSNTSTWWKCPSSGSSIPGDYTRGRMFSSIALKIVNGLNCGLSLKSDFFGINAEGDAPDNIAYQYADAYLKNLTFHQKSDIKRKTATSGSSGSFWDVRPEDFFGDLAKLFNVHYEIVDSVLILEHYSFFEASTGLDLTGRPIKKKVTYGSDENVLSEKFYFMDDSASAAFAPKDIKYSCGEEPKEQRCRIFSTDIVHIEEPDNADKIADEGFVLIATEVVAGENIIIDANSPLQWSQLLPNLHTFGRPYSSGTIAGGPSQTFDSWVPYIKQDPFQISVCCEDGFRAQDLIATDLGAGTVETATENIHTGKLELKISY